METNNDRQICIACNDSLSVSDRYVGLLACKSCGFLTADMTLSNIELEELYGQSYFHNGEYSDYKSEKVALQLNFKKRIRDLLSLPNVCENTKIFEIGCAYGFFLELLKENFVEASGIDIAKEPVQYARDIIGVDAHHGNFLEFEPRFRPDIVCLWDVIEHLRDPREFLKHTRTISASDSYILLTTGDIGSLNAWLRGSKWRLIHPPTHLHYFSKTSITQLLNNVGYQNVTFSYPAIWRTAGFIVNAIIGEKPLFRFLKTWIDNIPGASIPVPLNLFDVMLVTAQKRG